MGSFKHNNYLMCPSMTSEVKLHFMKNLRLYNVTKLKSFDKIRFYAQNFFLHKSVLMCPQNKL